MSNNQLEKVSIIPERSPVAVTPMDMIQRAVESNASMEVLEKMMALQERWEANQARKSFSNALADAKAEIKPIRKNRHVGFKSKKQGASDTSYDHEDLAEIARTIDPILAKHGLSYRFKASAKPGEPVSVSVIISHRDGHSEESPPLSGGRDETGNKNSHQAVASAVTYFSRYALKAALGLSAGEDDDARAAGEDEKVEETYVPPVGSVSQDQADKIYDLLEAKGASRAAFLNWAKQKRIEDIPAEQFDACIAGINNFKKAGK